MEIKYKDLSVSLKIAIVLAWIAGSLSVLGFLIGFFSAL